MVRRRRKYGGLRRKLFSLRRTIRRKGLLAIETKYFEGYLPSLAPLPWSTTDPTASPPRLSHLTAIAGGAGQTERTGGKVWIRKLRLHFFLSANTGATARNEQYVRIFVIRDLAPIVEDVSAPASTRIGYYLQATGINASMNLLPWQYINNYRTPRPQILYNKLIKVSKETGSDFQDKAWKKTINVFKPCHFSSNSANASVGKGHIYMFAISNETTAGVEPTLWFSWRTMYTDA